MVTVVGAVFIPLAAICFFVRPFLLLPLLVVTSLFEVTSIFDGAIGNYVFGVLPFFFVQVLIAFRFALLVMQTRRVLPSPSSPARTLAVLLLAFWGWSVMSSYVMPHLFAGMSVFSPREGGDVDIDFLAPLSWSLSNLAQAGYLTLNTITVLYALLSVKTLRESRTLTKAFYATVLIAAGAASFQLVAASLYPYALFNNNPGYAQGFEERIGDYQRITSTFGEPSGAGSYLAAIAIGLLAAYLSGKQRKIWLLAFFVVSLLMLATTATTGFAAYAVGFCMLLTFWNPFRKKVGQKFSATNGWIAAGVLLLIAAVVVARNRLFLETLAAVTIEKIGSANESFIHRMAADGYAFILFLNTWGIGVGLGSNRPSSLLMALLSTVGAIGTTLFVLILYRLVRLFPGKPAPAPVQLVFWALIAMLIGGAFGVPDLNRPALWGVFTLSVCQLNVYATNWKAGTLARHDLVTSRGPSLEGDPDVAPTG